MRFVATLVLVLSACQDNVATPFPAGLEPLEDNQVDDELGTWNEALRHTTLATDPINVHGRGYVLREPAGEASPALRAAA